MVDNTPLPALVADYKGFSLKHPSDINSIASEIAGNKNIEDLASRLQRRLNQLSEEQFDPSDPFPYLVCPNCGSKELKCSSATDYQRDESYFIIQCDNCTWSDWSQ
jgi:hypothetical protein